MSYYSSPPSSPLSGFFPVGPAGPHAFAAFQQDPRTTHSMYAALGPGAAHVNAAEGQAIARARAAAQHQGQNQNQNQNHQHKALGSLRKKLSK